MSTKRKFGRKYHLYADVIEALIPMPGGNLYEAFMKTLCTRGDSGGKAPWAIAMSLKVYETMVGMEKDMSYVCGLCRIEAEAMGITESSSIDLDDNPVAKGYDWQVLTKAGK